MSLKMFLILYFVIGFGLHYVWLIYVSGRIKNKMGYYDLPKEIRLTMWLGSVLNPFVLIKYLVSDKNKEAPF